MHRRTEDDTAPGEDQREPEPVRADGRPVESMDEITEPAGTTGTGPDESDHHNVADSTGDDDERFDAG